MKQNIQSLREKIANLSAQANHILNEKGDALWSAEDQAKFDGLTNDITLAKNQIKAAEKLRELEADEFFNSAAGQKPKKSVSDSMAPTQWPVALHHSLVPILSKYRMSLIND